MLAEIFPTIPKIAVDYAVLEKADNVVVHTWGVKPTFGFAPKAHWDLGPDLGIIDFERAAKISGARFTISKGAGAQPDGARLKTHAGDPDKGTATWLGALPGTGPLNRSSPFSTSIFGDCP